MVTINVRQLNDDVGRRLKRRAAGNNRSLEGKARYILARVVVDDMAAKRKAFRALAAGNPQTPSEVLIREDREKQAPRRLMRLGIDAGVAVKWLVAEEGSDAADRLLADGGDIRTLRLMASEIVNALWSADETVCADTVRLALVLNRPVYDCVYLALVHRLGARMVAADGPSRMRCVD